MEWFAQSSKFYIDLDDQGVSEAAQTLLMRACGYMAQNETSGYLAKPALKKLGLSRVSRRVDELVRERIMIETVNGSGYDFPGWFKWNEPLERQVKKRKADKVRVAEKRAEPENVARHSRDKSAMSHDYIDSNKNKEIPNSPIKASHLSNARASEVPRIVAVDDGSNTPPRGPAPSTDGWATMRAVIPSRHPQATKTALALECSQMLAGGTSPDDLRAALTLWLDKPNLGPRVLPSLVSEVIRNHARPAAVDGFGQASKKAASWLAIGQELAEHELNATAHPELKELA